MTTERDDIKPTPLDSDFRWHANRLISLARKEICVVTGEFSIYYFTDVREALRDALYKGVEVKAYLGKCDEDTIHRVVADGIKTYPGKKLPPGEDHYMVVDGKHLIVSKKHQRYQVNVRHGYYEINSESDARKKRALFDKLIDGINPVTVPVRDHKRDLKFIAELYQ
ncbi:MAG: hypothetical protein EPO62_05120 [Candidatus Nitrosotenuis sp.]|nr:MAG: hypothetical protein EPO62_05120 [Candidatus Nitrosotenuis sp.]